MFSALFDWLLGAGREAAVFIISMVPLVELRGAVPLGAAAGIPWTTLFPLAILGNMLPIPLLLVFGEKLLAWAETLPPLRKFAAAYKKKLLSKAARSQNTPVSDCISSLLFRFREPARGRVR